MDMPDVKITPIDSYQGEENDVILVSLVRSEALGFVANHSRVCVAMSRAKHGLYVIGNFSKLFITKSSLWRSLVQTMKTKEKFGTSLPLVCKGHGTTTDVRTSEDFTLVANGGCSRPCVSRLPCRHMCPFMCHPDPDNRLHTTIQCNEICHRLCKKQAHRCKNMCYQCYNGCGPCEDMVIKAIPMCGHCTSCKVSHSSYTGLRNGARDTTASEERDSLEERERDRDQERKKTNALPW